MASKVRSSKARPLIAGTQTTTSKVSAGGRMLRTNGPTMSTGATSPILRRPSRQPLVSGGLIPRTDPLRTTDRLMGKMMGREQERLRSARTSNAVSGNFPITNLSDSMRRMAAIQAEKNRPWMDKKEESLQKRFEPKVTDFANKYGYAVQAGYNDVNDSVRHAATAAVVSKELGLPAANIMGLAHELRALRNNKPENFKLAMREMGSDLYNNFVGSVVGRLPLSWAQKQRVLDYAAKKNILSVLVK